MGKEARLTKLFQSIAEYKEAEEQQTYSVNMGLKRREYSSVERAAKKLVEINDMLENLNQEIKDIQKEIEDESREVI